MNDNRLKQKSENIRRALEYAYIKHNGQTRKDGSKYIVHPIMVADHVMNYLDEEEYIIAGLLHDTVEDTSATYEEIEKYFGNKVAELVNELTSVDGEVEKIGKTLYLSNKLVNMSEKALVIKLCDRLHNVYDLINSPIDFRKRYIIETEDILSYLEKNRDLNNMHKDIIKDIKIKLEEYKKENTHTL